MGELLAFMPGLMETMGIGGGTAALGGAVTPAATAAVGGTSALGSLSALGAGAGSAGLGGAITTPLWQKGLTGILSGHGALPGMGFGASDLASKGFGKLGMTGASNFLAENPISLKVPLWGGGQPNTMGTSPVSPPKGINQQVINNELNDMINKKLDEFIKQMRMSR